MLSPDGATLYYVDEPERHGVFALDRHGRGSPRKITVLVPFARGGESTSGLRLSPDGRSLAMFASEGRQLGLFSIRLADGATTLIEPFDTAEGVQPVWSPDGGWLAYAHDETLYRVSRDGRTREALATQYRWQGWEVRWAPDGREFIFESDPCLGEKKGIHVYDSITKQVMHGVRTGSLPRWSRDGRTQVWTQKGERLRGFEIIDNFH